MQDHDPRDDVDQPHEAAVPARLTETSALAIMTRAEIDSRVATARQYPRDVKLAIKNINALATIDEETAASNLYALVRKKKKKSRGGGPANDEENKAIEGPSIRLAQTAAQCWGNCDYGARVIIVNREEKWLEAEGFFHDLETNARNTDIVRRPIATTSGYLFSADMINVTGRAACAIAKRNAILGGILRAAYWGAYQKSREMVAGTTAQLSVNRDKAIAAFAAYGVTPEQILETLDLEDVGEIKLDHIATLRAMFMSIKNGEATVEEMFAKDKPAQDANYNPLEKNGGADQQQTGGANELAKDNTSTTSNANDTGAAQGSGQAGGKPATESGAAASADAQPAASASANTAPTDAGASDNSGAAASSLQSDLLDGATRSATSGGQSSETTAKGAGESRGNGGSSAPTPSQADRLRSYSKHLLSIEGGGPAKLGKAGDAWTGKHGKFEGDQDTKRGQIYAVHLKRITGEINAEACTKSIEGIIG